MNINIKIKCADDNSAGVVFNRTLSTGLQQSKKNQLYGIPDNDRPVSQKKQPAAQNTQFTAATDKKKSAAAADKKQRPPLPQPSKQDVLQFEKEVNKNISDLNKNQASLGMVYTSNQILKQQNEILYENQKTINELLEHRKKSEGSSTEGNGKSNNNKAASSKQQQRKKQQDLMREVTSSVNKQLDEIKKMRDEIMKVAKEFVGALGGAGQAGGKPVAIPPQFTELNKNLKSLVETSQHNIDLLSPDKFDLVNRLQNFNIEGYTQHINQLKSQVAAIQKESETVEKQLRDRVAKLEKININPKFEEQLLQPYQKNIREKLATINFEETRQAIKGRLGPFDYVQYEIDLDNIVGQIREEMAEVNLTFQRYRIQVPELRLDPKQLKALEVKLPSILDEYKAAHGIQITKPPVPALQTIDLGKNTQALNTQQIGTTTAVDMRKTNSSQGATGSAKKPSRPADNIPSKPKDLATSVPLKRFSSEPFKTVLGDTDPEKQRRSIQKKTVKKEEEPVVKKKTRQEEDFQKYLENRANQQLQELYKEKRDRVNRMKNQLYIQEQDSQPMVKLTIDAKQRENLIRESRAIPKPPAQESIPALNQQIPRQQEFLVNPNNVSNIGDTSMQSIGAKLFEPRQNMVIKEIGKELLKQKIKDIFAKEKEEPRKILIDSNNNIGGLTNLNNFNQNTGLNGNMGSPQQFSANFAQGFLAVINNTFAEMNKGLVTNIEKKMQEREKRIEEQGGIHIPMPVLQEIPKPPVFNLNFDRNFRGNIGNPLPYQQMGPGSANPIQGNYVNGPPTFSSNFIQQQQAGGAGMYQAYNNYPNPSNVTIQQKDYKNLDISDISSYSHLELDKSDIKSQISGISGISQTDPSNVSRKRSTRL